MTSLEPQKVVFLLWAQSKVMRTFVNDAFKASFNTMFLIKIDNSLTSHKSEWGLVTLKTHFCGLRSRTRYENTWKLEFFKQTYNNHLQKPILLWHHSRMNESIGSIKSCSSTFLIYSLNLRICYQAIKWKWSFWNRPSKRRAHNVYTILVYSSFYWSLHKPFREMRRIMPWEMM